MVDQSNDPLSMGVLRLRQRLTKGGSGVVEPLERNENITLTCMKGHSPSPQIWRRGGEIGEIPIIRCHTLSNPNTNKI